ncbi:MAG: type II 3-dehydroquinate dehydratase [Nitrospirae bacterium]|jgi:3-dehydroquinate dehydratase-2|nr:type II 3-dehydroquinate dehydratase [Nitrospirota bacterium]
MAKSRKKVLVLHGPNLNLLGQREPSVYGRTTLEEINKKIMDEGGRLGIEIKACQSNSEGELIEMIHQAMGEFQAIVINPGGYTHTSVALRDAILASGIPTVEVHLSNIYNREAFRQHSMIAPVSIGQIAGFGPNSYLLGLRAAVDHLNQL